MCSILYHIYIFAATISLGLGNFRLSLAQNLVDVPLRYSYHCSFFDFFSCSVQFYRLLPKYFKVSWSAWCFPSCIYVFVVSSQTAKPGGGGSEKDKLINKKPRAVYAT